VEADGTIMPVCISKVESNEWVYVLEVEFLSREGMSERVGFDKDMRIVKRDRFGGGYVLDKSSEEGLMELFPDEAPSVLEKSRIFGRGAG
jgi:hypothetical protein